VTPADFPATRPSSGKEAGGSTSDAAGNLRSVPVDCRSKPVGTAPHCGTAACDGYYPKCYTATGFSNPVGVVFEATFKPTLAEDTREMVGTHFREAIRRARHQDYFIDRLVLNRLTNRARRIALRESIMDSSTFTWPTGSALC